LIKNAPSVQVCREWESTALKVNGDVRLTLIRIGVVLGKDGGALGLTSKVQIMDLNIVFDILLSVGLYW